MYVMFVLLFSGGNSIHSIKAGGEHFVIYGINIHSHLNYVNDASVHFINNSNRFREEYIIF